MDIRKYNRSAWDQEVDRGNKWTLPVSDEEIAAARVGGWDIVLTPTKPVPKEWFPELEGLDVLCLASGGGQQGPILAAAGASVTVFDNSPKQLEQDRSSQSGISFPSPQSKAIWLISLCSPVRVLISSSTRFRTCSSLTSNQYGRKPSACCAEVVRCWLVSQTRRSISLITTLRTAAGFYRLSMRCRTLI